jgi:hypothetical protein
MFVKPMMAALYNSNAIHSLSIHASEYGYVLDIHMCVAWSCSSLLLACTLPNLITKRTLKLSVMLFCATTLLIRYDNNIPSEMFKWSTILLAIGINPLCSGTCLIFPPLHIDTLTCSMYQPTIFVHVWRSEGICQLHFCIDILYMQILQKDTCQVWPLP